MKSKANTILFHVAFIASIWVVCSIFSKQFALFAEVYVQPVIPSAIVFSVGQNKTLLSSIVSLEYADSYYAISLICLFLSVLMIPLYLYQIRTRGVAGIDASQKPAFVFMGFVAASVVFFWHTYLNVDVYGGSDGDFSGILRPPIGNLFIGISTFVFTILFVASVVQAAHRLRSIFGRTRR